MAAPQPIVFCGDRFVNESFSLLAAAGVDLTGAVPEFIVFDGGSPCDVVSVLRERLQDAVEGTEPLPRAVVLSFYGFSSSTCLDGYGPTDPEFMDNIIESVEHIRLACRYTSVPLCWVSAPPHPPTDPVPTLSEDIADAVQALGVFVIRSGDEVADALGDWVEELPCLPDEGAPEGCSGGTVTVRSGDEIGFAFVGAVGASYSSGARRWTDHMITGVQALLADAVECTSWATIFEGCLPFYTGLEGGAKVAIVGDSIINDASGFLIDDVGEIAQVTLRGIDSIDLVQGNVRLVQLALSTDPDVLVVELGPNTALYGWDGDGVTALQAILDDAASVPAVVWVTITCDEPSFYDQFGPGTMKSRLEDLRDAVAAETGSYPNLTLADFGPTQDLNPSWYLDGLHMNDEGNAALSEFIRDAVAGLLP